MNKKIYHITDLQKMNLKQLKILTIADLNRWKLELSELKPSKTNYNAGVKIINKLIQNKQNRKDLNALINW